MGRFLRQVTRAMWVSLALVVGITVIDVALVWAGEDESPAEASAPDQAASDAIDRAEADALAGLKVTKTKVSLRNLKNEAEPTSLARRLLSLFGIAVLIGIAWIFSRNRKAISWRPVIWGVGLQIAFGLVVLSPQVGGFFFDVVNTSVTRLLSFSEAGSDFLFQTVESHEVTRVDLETGEKKTETFVGRISPPMKTLAFWILPTIIFFSALMNILYHLGLMQWLVRLAAKVMQKTMGTSGSETLSAAANIFVGQTEAPLVVKPFIADMTESEIHAIMVGGFATVAGGVLAAYVGFLHKSIPDIAGHLVMASIMSAPAALAVAKVLLPETALSPTAAGAELHVERPDINVIEALARGATEGLTLAVNVAAMLVAFVAMIALANFLLGALGNVVGVGLSMEGILGALFAPIAWTMGVPWEEAYTVGRLLGEKIVLTELIAYVHLADNLKSADPLSYRSAVICSYALCGFANFASIGIQIGGIGGIAPGRRTDLARLGLLAMVGGTIAAMMTATVAGIIL